MTREAAIKHIELFKRCERLGGAIEDALDMAIAALREQEKYEILKNSYAQLQDIFDGTYASNMAMGAALRKQQWISVEERFPKEFEPVFAYRREKSGKMVISAGAYVGDRKWRFGGYPVYNVTHWMPLPEPPKED